MTSSTSCVSTTTKSLPSQVKNKKQDILRKNRRRMAAEAMKQWNTCCHIEGVKKSEWPFSQDHGAGNPKTRAASNKDVPACQRTAKGRIRPKAFPTQKESWRMLAKNPVTCQCLRPSLWQAGRPNQNSPPAERAGQSLSHVICTWPKVCVLKDSAFQKPQGRTHSLHPRTIAWESRRRFQKCLQQKNAPQRPAAHSLKNAKKNET